MQTFNKKKVSNDSATEIAPENVDWLYVYVQAFIELLPLFFTADSKLSLSNSFNFLFRI